MNRFSVILITIAVASGIVGGVAGGLLARQYIWSQVIGLPLNGDITADGAGRQLVIRQPRNVVVEYTDRVQGVAGELRTHMVSLYPAESAYRAQWEEVVGTTTESFFAYDPSELLGEALIITNDGWLVTAAPAIDVSRAVAVDSQGRRYELGEAVTDPLTGVQFVRAVNADWSAAPFASVGSVTAGTTVVEVLGAQVGNALAEGSVAPPPVRSSEELYGFLLLDSTLGRGAIAVRLNGDVVGLEGKDGDVIPIQHITSALPMLLEKKSFYRPRLGVRYLPLTAAVSAMPLEGALVTAAANAPAVIPNSPADKAGIRSGDIITEVNGRQLGEGYSLSLAIQSQKSGDAITVTIQRAGEKREVPVTLEALAQ